MGLGIALLGSGALWAGSMALGRDTGLALAYPSCISIHLSSPEVPKPLGLLSSRSGVAGSPV